MARGKKQVLITSPPALVSVFGRPDSRFLQRTLFLVLDALSSLAYVLLIAGLRSPASASFTCTAHHGTLARRTSVFSLNGPLRLPAPVVYIRAHTLLLLSTATMINSQGE
jgi:hypothetical protein